MRLQKIQLFLIYLKHGSSVCCLKVSWSETSKQFVVFRWGKRAWAAMQSVLREFPFEILMIVKVFGMMRVVSIHVRADIDARVDIKALSGMDVKDNKQSRSF